MRRHSHRVDDASAAVSSRISDSREGHRGEVQRSLLRGARSVVSGREAGMARQYLK